MGILVGGALGSVLPGDGTAVGAFYGGAVANIVGGCDWQCWGKEHWKIKIPCKMMCYFISVHVDIVCCFWRKGSCMCV